MYCCYCIKHVMVQIISLVVIFYKPCFIYVACGTLVLSARLPCTPNAYDAEMSEIGVSRRREA